MKKGVLIAISLILTLTFIYLLDINPTGYAIYQPSGYYFNESEITLEDGIRLIPIENSQILNQKTNITLDKAEINGKDRTKKLNEIDNKYVNIKQVNKFIVFFKEDLKNQDKIRFYLKNKDQNLKADIWLCEEELLCAKPGLGSIEYIPEENKFKQWEEIELSGIENPQNHFRIRVETEKSNEKIRFDYIVSEKFENQLINNTSFPESSEIQTLDLEPEDLGYWTNIEINENLNNQTINYFYSIDSGNTWIESTNISGIQTRLRLKAKLNSNGQNTPIINSLNFNYEEAIDYEPVKPILECVYHHDNGTYTAYFGYLNQNDFPVEIPVGENNKFTPLPKDRGQTIIFQPGRTEYYPNASFAINFNGENLVWTLSGPDGSRRTSTASNNPLQKCSVDCTENWNCTSWTSCIDNSQARTCIDLNNCGTEESKPIEEQGCNDTRYQTYKREVQLKENIQLILNTTKNIENITFTVYTPGISNQGVEVDKLQIIPSEDINDILIEGLLNITYNLSELNIEESSLSLYYYNETIEEWIKLSSNINQNQNSISTKIDHLSIYGVYGETPETQESQPNLGSSGITKSSSSGAAPITGKSSSQPEIKHTEVENPKQKEELELTEPEEAQEITEKEGLFKINKSFFWALVGLTIIILIYLIIKVENKRKQLKNENF